MLSIERTKSKLQIYNPSTLYKLVNNVKNVCISRKKSLGYSVKFSLKSIDYVLWVWIDALFAYSGSWQKNKIYIVGNGRDLISSDTLHCHVVNIQYQIT